MRELPIEESHYNTILYLYRNLFGGQYGAKLKIPEIDVNPHFKGQVSYDGNVGVNFEGDFGKDFTTLYTFRYNLPVFYVIGTLARIHKGRRLSTPNGDCLPS